MKVWSVVSYKVGKGQTDKQADRQTNAW